MLPLVLLILVVVAVSFLDLLAELLLRITVPEVRRWDVVTSRSLVLKEMQSTNLKPG